METHKSIMSALDYSMRFFLFRIGRSTNALVDQDTKDNQMIVKEETPFPCNVRSFVRTGFFCHRPATIFLVLSNERTNRTLSGTFRLNIGHKKIGFNEVSNLSAYLCCHPSITDSMQSYEKNIEHTINYSTVNNPQIIAIQ